jgi:cytochrome b6-f complex iron-sulfur subunit
VAVGVRERRAVGGAPAMGAAMTRRRALAAGFWVGAGALVAGGGAALLNVLYPRKVEPFGGPVFVGRALIPRPGEPPRAVQEGHFLLAHLLPDEGRIAGDEASSPGGVLALWWRCPHLGCTVPWKDGFVTPHDPLGRRGWFNCNCHGSTYTKAGVRVYGPAPRSMDTMRVEVHPGGIIVQTGEREEGGEDNPRRAVDPEWHPRG